MIAVSGVTQEYVALTQSYEPKGTGIGYSIDNGENWNYMPQPICENCTLYESVLWGNQELSSLSVTTDINNVSYDIGKKDNWLYATSWAGGLRRFNYYSENPTWEIVPLPMDNQDNLICDSIDESNYELNPRDPEDGGNHNHKGFSVLGTDDYLWVGTANGINRGTIRDDGCIDWYHQTISNGLSGNWVVGIENQKTNDFDRIWAITWSAGDGESNSISYTDDYGVSWKEIQYFSNQNIKIYNLDFDGEEIYAASDEGLFYSEDYIHWEKVERTWIDSNTGDIILNNTVYSVLTFESLSLSGFVSNSILSSVVFKSLFIGTGDGLVKRNLLSNDNTIYRFWNNSASSLSEDIGFSVYPNPFFINDDGILNGDGHVRFIYAAPSSSGHFEINIYDFTMQHVVTLSDKIIIGDESVVIWDGRNELGQKVINGTYFCRLASQDASINDVYWTKLLVIN